MALQHSPLWHIIIIFLVGHRAMLQYHYQYFLKSFGLPIKAMGQNSSITKKNCTQLNPCNRER